MDDADQSRFKHSSSISFPVHLRHSLSRDPYFRVAVPLAASHAEPSVGAAASHTFGTVSQVSLSVEPLNTEVQRSKHGIIQAPYSSRFLLLTCLARQTGYKAVGQAIGSVLRKS